MSKNILEADKQHTIIKSMRIGCWIPKATNTHSVYVTLIDFLLEQMLQERASIPTCTLPVLPVLLS
jgi:hypothetical protein